MSRAGRRITAHNHAGHAPGVARVLYANRAPAPTSSAVVAVLAYRAISFWLPTMLGIAGIWRCARRSADGERPTAHAASSAAADSVG